MLLEHKLHATRLQSEVAVLSHEKVETEKVLEGLLEEISTFEEGVSTLESEMHQVCVVYRLTWTCSSSSCCCFVVLAGLHLNITYFNCSFLR